MELIDIAHAALLEAGRPDLAEWIHGFEDEDGFYLEYDDEILDEAGWALIDRAETLARQSVGLPARERRIVWHDVGAQRQHRSHCRGPFYAG